MNVRSSHDKEHDSRLKVCMADKHAISCQVNNLSGSESGFCLDSFPGGRSTAITLLDTPLASEPVEFRMLSFQFRPFSFQLSLLSVQFCLFSVHFRLLSIDFCLLSVHLFLI
ncbi:hypothetical protein BDZ97DRAFT_1020002 [Flammula alnicola]|nr:hypothetical protein BDZ97DRAFT_1020002 [Flammula alnicola]